MRSRFEGLVRSAFCVLFALPFLVISTMPCTAWADDTEAVSQPEQGILTESQGLAVSDDTAIAAAGKELTPVFDESHYGVDGATVASITNPMDTVYCYELYEGRDTLVAYGAGCKSASSRAVVPVSINGLPVIEFDLLEGNTMVEEVYLPDSVQYLYRQAFYGCTSLRSVNLGGLRMSPEITPNSLYFLFHGCTSLERLTMSDNADFKIESLGNTGKSLNIMDEDTVNSLKSIYLGSSMSDVTPRLFNGDSLEWVDVGEGNSLFSSHEGVVYSADGTKLLVMGTGYTGDYTIPDWCTSIEGVGFDECSSVSRIHVPASVTNIVAPYVFSKCTATFVLPKGSYTDAYIKEHSIDVRVEYDGKVDGYKEDISAAEVSVDRQVYTGLPLEPIPRVTLDGMTLDYRSDFEIKAYENNVETGTATITVAGVGDYFGETTATFNIERADVSSATVSKVADQTYTGKAIEPRPTVKAGSKTLRAGTDYALSYSSNVNAGTATITVTGRGNYGGSKSVTFGIKAADVSACTVDPIAEQQYTGKAIKPAVTVRLGSVTLKSGTDYTVAYKDNTKVGTATATVTGRGNLTGSRKVEFKIVEQPTTQEMHRLYNPNSGEHFYTASAQEKDALVKRGWRYEGVGWVAPVASETPVYRLYNANAGDHHYTTSEKERDALMRAGWKYEAIGWYSDDAQGTPLYRQYNPNAVAGSHNYTTSKQENDALVTKHGWKAEGIGWYGVKQ